MVLNVANALAAYRQNGDAASTASAPGVSTGASQGGSFTDTLKGFLGDATKSIQEGESAATSAATGKADISSVVTAINSAELMLETVVAIRDKVIAAYQDISKTAI